MKKKWITPAMGVAMTKTSTVFFLAGAIVSCGGPAKSPASPDAIASDSMTSEETQPVSPDPNEEMTEEEALGEQANSEEETAPLTTEDLQGALQVVLDDEAMRVALNLEEPGRFPLKISGSKLPADLQVTMIGAPVEVVTKPEDPKTDAVLIFTRIQGQKNSASFKFRYDVAGIRGSSTAIRSDGRWELKTSRFSEYLSK